MELSIAVVSWNVEELLAGCLASVYRSLQQSSVENEVLVIDNASSDDSVGMVAKRFPRARLIVNKHNRGFAAGINQALTETSGHYLLLLNPDTELRDNALQTLLGFMEDASSVAMAGPKLLYGDGSFQHSAFRFPSLMQAFLDFFPLHHRIQGSKWNGRYPSSSYALGQPFPVDHPLGACMMVRRQAVELVGGMDEQFFMYCEEVDWAIRLRCAGWQIYCVPAAEVVHHAGQSTRQLRDEMFAALWRSRFRLYAKHYGRFHNWAVRRIVRLGLWREERKARRKAALGLAEVEELNGRLAAYRRVRRMTYE